MKFKFFILTLIFVMFSSFTVYANSDNDTVKIGLIRYFSDISDFKTSNTEIEVGYEGKASVGKLFSNNGFTFQPVYSAFYKLDKNFTDYASATERAEYYRAMGFESSVGFVDSNIFYVFINASQIDKLPSDELTNSGSTISGGNNRLGVYVNGSLNLVFLNEAPYIQGTNGTPVTLDTGYRTYRGQISPVFNNNKMTLVNILTFKEYLYGVVPNEMPFEWGTEALKAQTIAARTFAHANLSKHLSSGYNLCDLDECQVYLGYTSEQQTTNEAVNQTDGLEIYYNNALIDAVFCSSSGGVTANSGDVWVNNLPYLKEKLDIYDTTGKTWERELSLTDITALAKTYADKNSKASIGNVKALRIDNSSSYGRINSLTVVGDSGEISLTKENIRYFFASASLPSLESRFFTISSGNGDVINPVQNNTSYEVSIHNSSEKIIDMSKYYVIGNDRPVSLNYAFTAYNNALYAYGVESSITQNVETTGDTIKISGKGWGHGVGLSQHGASGMAKAGFKYDEILKFYYSNIEIK